jgi:hypothetical protein
MRRVTVAAAFTLAVICLVAFTPTGRVLSDTVQEVWVTNFPEVFQVKGEVTVEEPVTLSELRTITDVLVPPVAKTESTRLVEAGTIATGGFAQVVLSLHGQVKGSVHKPGEVGAILIPDATTIQQAFRELGVIHFPLEVSAPRVSAETPYFASAQPRYQVGFDAYRVFLYNTSDKTVTVNVYAYLTN